MIEMTDGECDQIKKYFNQHHEAILSLTKELHEMKLRVMKLEQRERLKA